MNKKTRKLFTWCLVVTMVVTQMLFTNVAFAATRTSGDDRYKTAITISQQNFASADTVVIARGDDAADALAASPVAYQKKAPILLTETAALTDGVLTEIQRLKAKNVVIAGGTGAVSANDESALKNAGLTVTRVAGADRYSTSLALAQMLTGVTGVVVINGNSFADALSIAPIAAANGMAILSTDGKSMSADMTAFVGSKKVTIVGGTAAVSDSVASGATRLSGSDRYATNAAVINANVGTLKFAKVYFATGEDFPDALAGSVVAANNGSALVLVGSSLSSDMATLLKSKATKDSEFVIFGGTGAVSSSVASAIDGVFNAPPSSGPVSVTSAKATAADTITVQFSSVPADTSKVVFTVQRETTPMTVTASWNGSVATLKYSSNFPMGNYTVNVKNDTTDLGTSNLTIDQNKVGTIEVTTDTFAVTSDGKQGYFTYVVKDQYGNDITGSNSASISWTVPGVTTTPSEATPEAKGVIVAKVTDSNFNFLTLGSITITGVDSTDNIVISKTLKVSASVGTLSSIKLLEVTNPDNKSLTAGNVSSKWYISYEAKDMGGNLTKNFALLKGGLIDQATTKDDNSVTLSTSGYITAKLVNTDGNGVIELTVNDTTAMSTDMPVTVTAITMNGTTSTLNLTLKKQSQVNAFTIMAPTTDIAYGDAKEIPYAAYDQDGKALTAWDDIVDETPAKMVSGKVVASKNSAVNLSPAYTGSEGFYWVKRGDGTAKLMYQAPAAPSNPTDITKTLTASTNTGKFSQVTITIRKPADPSTLTINNSGVYTRMAEGAAIRITHETFTAKDIYGRTMDLGNAANDGVGLYVQATPVGSAADYLTFTNTMTYSAITTTGAVATQNDDIFISATGSKANLGGTATVKFSLMQGIKDPVTSVITTKVITSKTVDFTVYKMDDIKNIALDSTAPTTTIYNTMQVTDRTPGDAGNPGKSWNVTPAGNLIANYQYTKGFRVWGVDSNGNNVVLPADTKIDASSSNAYMSAKSENVLLGGGTTVGPFISATHQRNIKSAADFNKVDIASNAAVANNADVTAVVSVSALIDGNVKSTSVTMKASQADAVVKTISAPDEIDLSDWETGAVISDIISAKDQYGTNMLSRKDSSITVYLDGAQMISSWAATTKVATIAQVGVAHTITVVCNNGQTIVVTVKAL